MPFLHLFSFTVFLRRLFWKQARQLRRRRLGGHLQVLHHLPRRHADVHQVVPADGRVRALGQRQALLHPHHQQVGRACVTRQTPHAAV